MRSTCAFTPARSCSSATFASCEQLTRRVSAITSSCFRYFSDTRSLVISPCECGRVIGCRVPSFVWLSNSCLPAERQSTCYSFTYFFLPFSLCVALAACLACDLQPSRPISASTAARGPSSVSCASTAAPSETRWRTTWLASTTTTAPSCATCARTAPGARQVCVCACSCIFVHFGGGGGGTGGGGVGNDALVNTNGLSLYSCFMAYADNSA